MRNMRYESRHRIRRCVILLAVWIVGWAALFGAFMLIDRVAPEPTLVPFCKEVKTLGQIRAEATRNKYKGQCFDCWQEDTNDTDN